MENEMFTFVTLGHKGHTVENLFLSRHDADKLFKVLCESATDNVVTVAYYCASVGGLVNAWHD